MSDPTEQIELRAKVQFTTGGGSPPMMMVTIHDSGRTFTGVANSDAETINDVVLRVIANAIAARKMAK